MWRKPFGPRRPQGSHDEKKVSLSEQVVYKMVKRHQREAKTKEVSHHDFRKAFVGDLLDAIGDLSTV